ncbi:MAG: hypothetical protein SVV80_01955 [Planctomycetota bacterium]|nr:hypothetical protein [Planctomycetota bacterium]
MIAIHVTHEAVEKMGGIGAVVAGLVTSADYKRVFGRTILVGPALTTDRTGAQRFGYDGKVLYSSIDGIDAGGWAEKFRPVEQTYQVGIIYGTRQVIDGDSIAPAEGEPQPRKIAVGDPVEVLLVDVFRCNPDRLNLFKSELFTRFSIPSDEFEHIWEFEQYVRLAEPVWEAMHVIGCTGGTGETPAPSEQAILFSHEYMGLPTALKAVMDSRAEVRTVFYAHEVASVRRIVETHPAHDLMFYNLLEVGEQDNKGLEDFFPAVCSHFKHPLIKAARYCDAIFSVGDFVGREMRFLHPRGENVPVEMVYNGVPVASPTPEERQEHRSRMKKYAMNLFDFEPDYIFTHVARPVLSKGIWRDLRILHELDDKLTGEGRSAVYFMLGTLAGQRREKDILRMERDYGWPVHHREGYPDICNGEEVVGELFEDFNRHHEAVKVVLVNQFGWRRDRCGLRMPEEMTFADVRMGTDVEFGLSVYEPFGISQLEPLGAGAICVVSNVCGCVGLLKQRTGGEIPDNVLVGDFIRLPSVLAPTDAMQIDMAERDAIETSEAKRLARRLAERLPKNDDDIAELLAAGTALGKKITWERTVADFFLPAVERMCNVEKGIGQSV